MFEVFGGHSKSTFQYSGLCLMPHSTHYLYMRIYVVDVYLAYLIFGHRDVSSSQVSVDECLTGKVGHPRGSMLTESK